MAYKELQHDEEMAIVLNVLLFWVARFFLHNPTLAGENKCLGIISLILSALQHMYNEENQRWKQVGNSYFSPFHKVTMQWPVNVHVVPHRCPASSEIG
jgi:hypothetical protein